MKPLMLHGHERAITQIKYNREGDLLFSCSKDHTPNIWFSINGERLGTFVGHNGACWCIDVNYDTSTVVTGAADNTCKIWNVENGRQLSSIQTKTAVRSCNYSFSCNLILYTTDKTMGKTGEVHIIDPRQELKDGTSSVFSFPINEHKVSSSLWGPLDESIITGHDNGEINVWDFRNQTKTLSVKEHKDIINDLQFDKKQILFITASRDNTAKLFCTKTLEVLKVYKTERPVNSAAISPIRDHVLVGGGQEAMDVTTTSARIGKFDAKFFHLVFEEEFGRVKDHFGPINSVAFHPDGKGYSSGGEDGYVRVHTFDQPYLDFDYEY